MLDRLRDPELLLLRPNSLDPTLHPTQGNKGNLPAIKGPVEYSSVLVSSRLNADLFAKWHEQIIVFRTI